MPHVHLISGTNSMRLRGLVHPSKDELDLGLATDVSGGGEVYVSQKSVPSLTLVRSFAGVRNEDYESLRSWYTNICQGARNAFIFIDADGSTYTVRWTNSPLDWQRDAENLWSGSITLRVEDFEP